MDRARARAKAVTVETEMKAARVLARRAAPRMCTRHVVGDHSTHPPRT